MQQQNPGGFRHRAAIQGNGSRNAVTFPIAHGQTLSCKLRPFRQNQSFTAGRCRTERVPPEISGKLSCGTGHGSKSIFPLPHDRQPVPEFTLDGRILRINSFRPQRKTRFRSTVDDRPRPADQCKFSCRLRIAGRIISVAFRRDQYGDALLCRSHITAQEKCRRQPVAQKTDRIDSGIKTAEARSGAEHGIQRMGVRKTVQRIPILQCRIGGKNGNTLHPEISRTAEIKL